MRALDETLRMGYRAAPKPLPAQRDKRCYSITVSIRHPRAELREAGYKIVLHGRGGGSCIPRVRKAIANFDRDFHWVYSGTSWRRTMPSSVWQSVSDAKIGKRGGTVLQKWLDGSLLPHLARPGNPSIPPPSSRKTQNNCLAADGSRHWRFIDAMITCLAIMRRPASC